MRRKVTIPDIAKIAGVSKSTVSLALQDSEKLRKSTRELVQKTAKEMGYIYNRAAANLRGMSSNLIGLIVNDLTYSYFSELAVGIEKALGDAGYMVVLANTAEDASKLEKIVCSLAEHNAAGIILCSSFGTDAAFIERVKMGGMALVHVGRPVDGAACDYVAVDDEACAAMATEHMLSKGIKKLAFIGGNEETQTFKLRSAGFKGALRDARIGTGDYAVTPCRMKRKDIFEATHNLLAEHPDTKGIVCYSDLTAIGVISALREKGLTAGEDISVSGFDDIIASGDLTPSITTIQVHIDQLGKSAAKLLINRFENPDAPFVTEILPAELIVRESSQIK